MNVNMLDGFFSDALQIKSLHQILFNFLLLKLHMQFKVRKNILRKTKYSLKFKVVLFQ